MEPQFTAIADHALLVTFADEITDGAHAAVVALDKVIATAPPVGLIEVVPALVNLLVSFDPLITDHLKVEAHVRGCMKDLKIQELVGVQRRVQVCYDAPFSPDIDAVAAMKGVSTDVVIKAHLDGDFHVLMYGFAPGYAYLSGVAENIQVPRKAAPVRDVPAGSVIIAGPQCLVTTLTMPTGWSIIGRSPTPILTEDPSHPFLFDVGDRVTFERIDLARFERMSKVTAHG